MTPHHIVLDDLDMWDNNENRVVVYTYENQRYALGRGWTANNLLPTDRPAWSDKTGELWDFTPDKQVMEMSDVNVVCRGCKIGSPIFRSCLFI